MLTNTPIAEKIVIILAILAKLKVFSMAFFPLLTW